MKTNVQSTSIHAYRANDLSESREVVAREILSLTRANKPAYIRIVTETLKTRNPNIDKSSVSGRFNDLHQKFPEGFMIDGVRYKMQYDGQVFDPKSGKNGQNVQGWKLVNVNQPQTIFG